MALQFAVLGNPIEHSLSPIIHQRFALQFGIHLAYEKILGSDVSFEEQVERFFAAGGMGLNVTLPFKQRAFAMAKETTIRCQSAAAANTLCVKNGHIWADNTDGIGLIRDLSHYMDIEGAQVLLLGAGGAASGIIGPLLEANLTRLVLANRTLDKAKLLIQSHLTAQCPPDTKIQAVDLNHISGEFDLVINATSASLTNSVILLPEECLAKKPFCYDLAYAHKKLTPFVSYAKNQGCAAADGLGMLVEQAAEAFYIWHGARPETKPVLDYLHQ